MVSFGFMTMRRARGGAHTLPDLGKMRPAYLFCLELYINLLTAADLYIDAVKLGLFVRASVYRCLLPFYRTKL